MLVITNVRLYRNPYTVINISDNNLSIPDEKTNRELLSITKRDSSELLIERNGDSKEKRIKFVTNALFLQPFVRECLNSEVYRSNVIKRIHEFCGYPDNGTVLWKLVLEPPAKEIIDYSWNNKILHLVWTRVEIENAFSWLSTLGGAYSALGDYFDYCAEEAGRISIRQYKLSKMLGDDGLAARSRLYYALARSQKGQLKIARHMIRNVAEFARVTHDTRLTRMCQGVWAKLKYLRLLKKQGNNILNQNGHT